MILLERDDVIRLGMDGWDYPFCVDRDDVDVLAEGPFLLVVHNEHAWAGQDVDSMEQVAGRRIDPPNHRRWKYLADLYAAAMGISRHSITLRYVWMSRHLNDKRGQPFLWDDIYHWPEGSDLAWSALVHGHHPWFRVYETEGQRMVEHL